MYKKGTVMLWKNTNKPAYQKMGDNHFDWWVSLDSTYLQREQVNGEMVDVVYPESNKPLYRNDGTLNRYGFKWTDIQVLEYYSPFMSFLMPNK